MYRKDSEMWLKHIDFILLDMICLQIAYVFAYAASGYGWNLYGNILYRRKAIVLEVVNLLVIFSMGTMSGILRRGHYREFVRTAKHGLIVGAVTLLYLFLLHEGQFFSRLTMVLTIVFYILLSYLVREYHKKNLARRSDHATAKKLLVITSRKSAEQVLENMKKNNYAGYRIIGIATVDGNWTGRRIKGIPVVADEETVVDYVCQEWVDEVLMVIPTEIPYPDLILRKLESTGVTVHQSLERIVDIPGKKQFVEKVGNYTVITTSMNYATTSQLILKRMMDIAGGLVGCLLTAVIFVFIAPAIYLASPGPIFFTQERVGQNGKHFKMYKFRSMYMDAEERKAALMKENRISDGKMFKLDFDPRVIGNKILPDGTKKTGIGDFIRRTSLDEFPQFFNVLKGDMSIVGTRPPLISETNLYEPHHKARLAIKPGITGMWQISGRSDITDFEEVVNLDKEYINNWNIGLDIKILFKTILVVLKEDGSM